MFWRKKKQTSVEEARVQNPNFDESFKVAFGIVISEIEGADEISVASLFNAVEEYHGDPRKQIKALLDCFKGTNWKWPSYEAYIRGKQDVIYETEVDAVEGYAPEELLTNFNISKLKKVYLQCIGSKAKSILRKNDLIKDISKAADNELLVSLRHELVGSIKDPKIIDKKEMATALALRIDRLAYAMHRRQQLLANVDRRPYWEFSIGVGSSPPMECKSLHGTIKHYADPFWEEHYPPCWHPDCTCSVHTYFEELQKIGNKAH